MASLSAIGEFAVPEHPPQPAFHMVRSLKAGPLTKQGSLFKSWKRRLFILQEQFLLYYVSSSDTSPRGALWIKDCHVRDEPEVSRLQSIKTGQSVYCFSLQCQKSWNIEAKRVFKQRTYLLLADSFQDQSDWMAILGTMARAGADLDLDWEQSYAQTFSMDAEHAQQQQQLQMQLQLQQQQQRALGSSAASSINGGGSSAASVHRGGSGPGHKRHKSKSASLGSANASTSSKSIYSGHHARHISAATHDSSGGSGGSGSARPRTPLASTHSTQSLSSSAAASLLARDHTGASSTPPQPRSTHTRRHLRRSGGDGGGDGGGGGGVGGPGGFGGASTSGGVSLSSGDPATPRQHSLSHTHSHSLSDAEEGSLSQRSFSLTGGTGGTNTGAQSQTSVTRVARPGGGGLDSDGEGDLQLHDDAHLTPTAAHHAALTAAAAALSLQARSASPPGEGEGEGSGSVHSLSLMAAQLEHGHGAFGQSPSTSQHMLSDMTDSRRGSLDFDDRGGLMLLQHHHQFPLALQHQAHPSGPGLTSIARSLTPLAGAPPPPQSLTPRQEDMMRRDSSSIGAAAGGKDLTPRQHPLPQAH